MLKNLEGVVGAVGGAVTTNGGATKKLKVAGLGLLALEVRTATTKLRREAAWMKLLAAARPLLRSIERTWKGWDIDSDDLTAAVQLGFVEGVESWDYVGYPAGFASWTRQIMRTAARAAVRGSRLIRGHRDRDVLVKIKKGTPEYEGTATSSSQRLQSPLWRDSEEVL